MGFHSWKARLLYYLITFPIIQCNNQPNHLILFEFEAKVSFTDIYESSAQILIVWIHKKTADNRSHCWHDL